MKNKEKIKKYSADFETCTWLDDETYVWAWCFCEIGNEDNIKFGNDINTFMRECEKSENAIFYFNNLKFDGEFILYYLLKNGYEFIENEKDRRSKTFTTLIDKTGIFYTITVYFSVKNKQVVKCTFIDSLKIIGFSVEELAKCFGLELSKLELNYDTPREYGHILTEHEMDYIKNDVVIVAKSLNIVFNQGLTRMTRASNALADYKDIIKKSRFDRLFPKLNYETDKDLRASYKGGFTYLNPIYKEKDNGKTVVLDVNSLYPSVMYYELLPFGEPIFFDGKYKDDKIYNLYIQRITCSFEIKENKIPTIQIKGSRFIDNEYLTSSNDEIVSLTLTNIDLKLFLEHYNVYDLKYICGWKFKSMKGMFKEYIDKWIKVKNEATILGNKGQRTLAKLQLNSLYGKFATSLDGQSKYPYLEDGIVKYKLLDKEIREGLYLPIGSFITSYARYKTITTSQKIKEYSIKKYGVDMYIYSDTDSIHTTLNIEELKQFCEIDDIELGKWKHEATATRSRFVRQKCYLEEIDEKIKITCAGMPKRCYEFVEWNKFKEGFTCGGKLTFKHVKGGVKLVETTFEIKRDKKLKNAIKSF